MKTMSPTKRTLGHNGLMFDCAYRPPCHVLPPLEDGPLQGRIQTLVLQQEDRSLRKVHLWRLPRKRQQLREQRVLPEDLQEE